MRFIQRYIVTEGDINMELIYMLIFSIITTSAIVFGMGEEGEDEEEDDEE